jgi:tetratricopeptide (TPR) repeat protein
LFEHAVGVTANNHVAYVNPHGQAQEEAGRVEEALESYRRALLSHPDYAIAHFNLGILYARLGRVDEAVYQYQEPLEERPRIRESPHQPGGDPCQTRIGRRGRPALPRGHRNSTGRQDRPQQSWPGPGKPGRLRKRGEEPAAADEAASLFKEALRLMPDYADARRNLNWIAGAKGQLTRRLLEVTISA